MGGCVTSLGKGTVVGNIFTFPVVKTKFCILLLLYLGISKRTLSSTTVGPVTVYIGKLLFGKVIQSGSKGSRSY